MSKDDPLLSNCPLETAEPSHIYARVPGYKKKIQEKDKKKTRKEKKNERRRNQYARVRRYKITSTLGLLVRGDPQKKIFGDYNHARLEVSLLQPAVALAEGGMCWHFWHWFDQYPLSRYFFLHTDMHSPLDSIPHIFGRMHAPVHRRTCFQHMCTHTRSHAPSIPQQTFCCFLCLSLFLLLFLCVFFCMYLKVAKSYEIKKKKKKKKKKKSKLDYFHAGITSTRLHRPDWQQDMPKYHDTSGCNTNPIAKKKPVHRLSTVCSYS